MTRILLDTSAYSAFMRGHPDARLAIQEAEEIFLTPIVLGELHAGFHRGRRRQKNETELRAMLSSARVRVVDVNEETAERYAVILNTLWQAGSPIPTNDMWIAASAMQHGLRILTTDLHFDRVPQVLVTRLG
jgi:tRNA(fMet)-specific endonuclease VapC